MKISSILTCFLIIILTTGCGQVVYSIKPDSPPKMSIAEAKDALELSLSLASIIPGRGRVTLRGDELVLGSTVYAKKTYYDDISREVGKQGKDFYVNFTSRNPMFAATMETLYWKSEEDARSFVDAAYALRKARFQKDIGKTEIATLPSPSPEKEVPRQSSKPTAPVKKQEIILPDLAKASTKPTAPPVSAPPKPPVVVIEEKIPPKITITSPNITHNESVIARKSDMTVTGMVESKVGLANVMINDQPVDLDEKGNFSADILLKVGKNNIKVTAIDVRKNQVTKNFVINRERVQTATISQSDASSPKIVIVSPDVTRAVSLVAKKSSITVIGKVESKIDLADVLINGQQTDLDEKGNFSADVLLKVGKNNITVTAIDIRNNQVTKNFVINRESGKIATVKKEEPVPETGFTSGKYYAMLIAVQDYSNPEIGKLDYPVSDARQLMEVLSSRYNFEKENIKILNNPDRRTIYKTLQDLRKQLTGTDSLLIFYAGHGMWLDDMKQGFWLPSDAAGLNDPSDWIPNSNIRDYIKAIKAKHILLIADACFSGGIFKTRAVSSRPGTSIEKIYEMPSRKAMTSGSLKTVPDQSVFVEFLIKRLKDNREPYLDSQKLFTSLRDSVINNSKVNQTPLYGAINEAGDEGGDFVFVRRQ
jgi:Caspase domain/Glucodextranase, domain B